MTFAIAVVFSPKREKYGGAAEIDSHSHDHTSQFSSWAQEDALLILCPPVKVQCVRRIIPFYHRKAAHFAFPELGNSIANSLKVS